MMATSSHSALAASRIPTLMDTGAQSSTLPTPPRSPGTVSTNTPVVAQKSQVRQRKVHISRLQPLDLGNIRCCITSTYGQILTNDALVSVAAILLRMEHDIVSMIAQHRRFSLSIRSDAEQQFRAEQDLESLLAIKTQIEQIQEGKAKIHADYLMDEYMVAYWEEAFDILRYSMLWDPKDQVNYKTVLARLKKLERQGRELARYLEIAAAGKHIDYDTERAIHQKWEKFSSMIDIYHREIGTDRECCFWPIEPPSYTVVNSLKKFSEAQRKLINAVWGTLIGAAVLSGIFMGIGFFYSSNEPGRWRDPDFWFLLQSSTVQLCGLLVIGLSFNDVSKRDWLAGTAATCFAIIAPVLYVKVPTQYSMWSSAASGVFQAILLMQRAVSDVVYFD